MLTRVVAESGRYAVIDKPAGVLSVPGKGEENQVSVASWARARFPHATGPLIVHRLDMETSGLMVIAMDAAAHRDLSRQFESRAVSKRYTAIVRGQLAPEQGPGATGEITLPMRLDVEHRPLQIVDHAQGRPAHTAWRVLTYVDDTTRVELSPTTGRTHQLRVHMAAIGHPIVGDSLYGGGTLVPRLMLHACWLAFAEPRTGAGERGTGEGTAPRVQFESPADFLP